MGEDRGDGVSNVKVRVVGGCEEELLRRGYSGGVMVSGGVKVNLIGSVYRMLVWFYDLLYSRFGVWVWVSDSTPRVCPVLVRKGILNTSTGGSGLFLILDWQMKRPGSNGNSHKN